MEPKQFEFDPTRNLLGDDLASRTLVQVKHSKIINGARYKDELYLESCKNHDGQSVDFRVRVRSIEADDFKEWRVFNASANGVRIDPGPIFPSNTYDNFGRDLTKDELMRFEDTWNKNWDVELVIKRSDSNKDDEATDAASDP